MGADGALSVRSGEKREISATITALPVGSLLTLQPGGTITVKNELGVAVVSAAAVTGRDTAALAAPRMWYLLDTGALALPVGNYYAVFRNDGLSSDGSTATFSPEIIVTVLPAIEATYDAGLLVSSALYQCRLYCADTDVSAAVWSDSELLFFLTAAGQVAELAAARALRSAASDAAKIALITGLGTLKSDESRLYEALITMADVLERQFAIGGSIASPDLVFNTTSGNGTLPGSMDVW